MKPRRNLKPVSCLVFQALLVLFLQEGGSFCTGATHRVPDEFEGIQQAIDAASEGDTVLVAEGEYEIQEPIDFLGKAILVKSKDGAENTIIRMTESLSKNRASVVYFHSGEDPDSILDGFTLTGGQGTDWQPDNEFYVPYGGGILCFNNSSPTIRNNHIYSNSAQSGGGISVIKVRKKLIFENNIVSQNKADIGHWSGIGGAGFSECEDLIIRNNYFLYNSPGGVRLGGCRRTLFIENKIIDNQGTGLKTYEGDMNVFAWNEIYNNTAYSAAGVFLGDDSRLEFAFNEVCANEAVHGGAGGISICDCCYNASRVTGCLITHNRAGSNGGGVYTGDENLENWILTHCVIAWNEAGGFGGGIGSYDYWKWKGQIRNCTIYGNFAQKKGGGLGCDDGSGSHGSIVNCILSQNRCECEQCGAGDEADWYNQFLIKMFSPEYSICDSFSNSGLDCNSEHGFHLLCTDPLFVDPEGGDFHLQLNSPAIDAGMPSMTEADGSPSDIGAFPYNTLPVECPQSWTVRADADASGVRPAVRLICWRIDGYDSVKVLRDGNEIGHFEEEQEIFWDRDVQPGAYVYSIIAAKDDFTCPGINLDVEVPESETLFRRSDVNSDGSRNIADAVSMLHYLFKAESSTLSCEDAADSNDDGILDIADAIHLLGWLFASSDPPPAPFDECGIDPTRIDDLTCDSYPPCEQP